MLATTVHYGIVLRNNQAQNKKITLLDQRDGMFSTYVQKPSMLLQHGRLVRYAMQKKASFITLNDIECISEAADWVKNDIFFLHHVLEIIHAALGVQSPAPEVFSLCLYLYHPLQDVQERTFKLYFLAKLFATLGIYPENHESFSFELFHLISGSLDTMVRSAPSVINQSSISDWLYGCLMVHPEVSGLKTAVFFTYLD